jgi:7,8-dihydroneopterin aldolase/epimerase/oxygenase
LSIKNNALSLKNEALRLKNEQLRAKNEQLRTKNWEVLHEIHEEDVLIAMVLAWIYLQLMYVRHLNSKSSMVHDRLSIMDSIQLTGLRCYGYTGYLEEERVLGQWFEINLTIWVNLTAAGRSDRIEDTLDYRLVIADVNQLVNTAKFETIERLASAIADVVLQHEIVDKVCVHLSKTAPPIPNFNGKISVKITRSK